MELENINNVEDVTNVCRLCLGKGKLISIFDDKMKVPENIRDVIQITTGITISPSDKITQKLCYKCVSITNRMFEFRSNSILNNLQLKEKAAPKNKSKLHKSVQSLLIEHPQIVLPFSITKTNISPVVCIDKEVVQKWIVKHQGKEILETKTKKCFKLQENKRPRRDSDKNKMPHVIRNEEIFSNSRVKLASIIDRTVLPPFLEPAAPLQVNDKMNKNNLSSTVKYGKKKKTETKVNEVLTLQEKEEQTRDLESDTMPHLLPNVGEFCENLREVSELTLEETSDLPPLLEPAALHDKEPNKNQTSLKNDIYKDQGSDAIANRINLLEENNAKRKLSPSWNNSKSKKVKLTNDDIYDSNHLLELKYVNKRIFICEICNAILYNVKDLKKHKTKHMRCSLCKKSFRSMRETQLHCEKNCKIKQIMNNLPKIYLKRCDKSYGIRRKYPSAFVGFNDKLKVATSPIQSDTKHPQHSQLEELSDTLIDMHSSDKPDEIFFFDFELPSLELKYKSETSYAEAVDDLPVISKIMENTINNENSCVNTVQTSSAYVDPEETDDISSISDDEYPSSPMKLGPELSCDFSDLSITPKVIATALDKDKSRDGTIKPKHQTPNVPTFKTEVKITGENILDINLDNDEDSLLGNLLKLSSVNTKESSIQTQLPNNCDIITSLNKDKLFELKNLRAYLTFLKIPVNISHAARYSVEYGDKSSFLSKIDNSWSVVESRERTVGTNNGRAIIPTNVTNNQNIATLAVTVPPVISIRTSSTLNTREAGIPGILQNVQRANTPSTESFNQITRTTSPKTNNKINTGVTISDDGEKVRVSVNNGNKAIQTKVNIEVIRKDNANVLNNASIQNIANVEGNIDTLNIVNEQTNTNNQKDPYVQNQVSRVINIRQNQTQMKHTKIDDANNIANTSTSKIIEAGAFAFNPTSIKPTIEKVSLKKNTVYSPAVHCPNVILYNSHNNNIFDESIFTSKPTPKQNSNISLNPNNELVHQKNTGAATNQMYAIVNRMAYIAPPNFTNTENNTSYILDETAATVTSKLSNDSRSDLLNTPMASKYTTNGAYCFTNVSSTHNMDVPRENHTQHKKPLQTSNYHTPQNMIALNNFPNVNSQFRTSSFPMPYNCGQCPSSISRVNGSVISPYPFLENNSMLPVTIAPEQPTKYNEVFQFSSTETVTGEATNQKNGNSASTTATHCNRNANFVPLIRVKNVAELR